MTARARLRVVFVNFRTPALTVRSVNSLLAHGIAQLDGITVVDNCSGDESLALMQAALPQVTIKPAPRNDGYGAGINFGVSGVDSEYLLILNPDTYFERDSVTEVLDYMDEHPDVGMGGLGLVNPDGSRQYSARRFYSTLDIVGRRVPQTEQLLRRRIDRHLMIEETNAGQPFEAEWVMGTGFIIRRDLFLQLGGMDEAYFLYMEDVDLCARIWVSGHKVVCFPASQLVHDHQRTSATGLTSRAGRAHLKSLMHFARKFCLPLLSPPGVDRIVRSAAKRA
ncbi:glycosyltransferase family 2 protein [Devosia nitrariae]|uniref:glycosyltransferase family 2 protein n=1 Tax=Devosia nitrariae TaxID=2071872 RepID=UPI0024E0EA83|nr:glycosyltransferase family 2 protein [Devosia nitrariae]